MTATLRRLVAKEQFDDAASKTQKIGGLDSDISHNDAEREQSRENLAAAEREYAQAVQAENVAIKVYQADPTSQIASQLLDNGRYSRGETMANYTRLVTKKLQLQQNIAKTK